MRGAISLIHIESGEVVSCRNMVSDYKPNHQTTYNGTDVIHFDNMMFLLPFGTYVVSQGDYIVLGNVQVTTNNLTETLKTARSFQVKSIDEVEQKFDVNYKYKVMAQ